MKSKIVVVDDDAGVRRVVVQALESKGYLVEAAAEGKEAVRLLDSSRPDLAILDWDLPEMTGLQICRFLRSHEKLANVPVLMLTVFSETRQKVAAFETGADDYLTKPFEVPELLARVAALLRRGRDAKSGSEVLEAGPIRLDAGAHTVTVAGEPASLRPKEFELLQTLLASTGRVLSREHLIERVWGYNSKLVTTRTVDAHIARLRGKLGKKGAALIQTVPGFGFKIDKEEK
ncbi:MAG: hypothetical protein A2636_05505 [Elusimicrobia bacterium RIFCSPHIGHO2_01_FULL_64_10]|nr:MAG: hypothetical protein A2636_05505 [Elusimicrobia bacterium RIFCSPHIGHO2_01_FULL_64_10]